MVSVSRPLTATRISALTSIGYGSGAFLVLCLLFFGLARPATAEPAAAIASAHPLATQAGLEVLAKGGNAFDASVAVSAALAVVEPYSSGIGGGGFWLLHRARDGREIMLDGRERAPLAAHRDLYLNEAGEFVPGLSIDGPLAAGIPGEPAALVHLAERYGRLSLAKSLAPAIRLAAEGFPVDAHYRRMAGFRLKALRASTSASRIFLDKGEVPELGYKLRQPELAEVLRLLAEQGRAGFYTGPMAQKLVAGVREAGGIWTRRDLAEYRVVEREPLRGRYRGVAITTAAPPSSGGVVLLTMLNILQGDDLGDLDPVSRKHLIIEAMRRAYRDRAEYLGDPDYVSMPLGRLIHPYYAAGLRASIRLDAATPSDNLPGFASEKLEGADTTHFSILDRQGNRVAATLSINYPFGSGFVVPGTGVLLNDEMDDFAARPGTPNAYGLVGAQANAIAPGKRMLSSMTPTFLEDERGIALVGTPGGSRIITMVLSAVLDFVAGRDPETWVSRPRFHHQYLPDRVAYEPGGFNEDEVAALRARGHELEPLERTYGNMQVVYRDKKTGETFAASDPRGIGAAEVR